MFKFVYLSVSLAAFVSFTSSATAEATLLSEMDRETEVYIQRGNQGRDVDCYFWLLDDLRPDIAGDHVIYVSFDDPEIDGIGVSLAETDVFYTCEKGQLRSWEMGEYVVVREFE